MILLETIRENQAAGWVRMMSIYQTTDQQWRNQEHHHTRKPKQTPHPWKRQLTMTSCLATKFDGVICLTISAVGMTDEDFNRKRLWKRRRKARSDQTEQADDSGDPSGDDSRTEAVSPIIIGAICASFVVFLCVVTGLVCLWYVFNRAFGGRVTWPYQWLGGKACHTAMLYYLVRLFVLSYLVNFHKACLLFKKYQF